MTVPRPRPASEDGFALMMVLGVVALLMLVAILLQRSVIAEVRSAALLAGRERIEALGDGLARLALRHLVVASPSGGLSGAIRLDGTPRTCRIGQAVASISVVSTDGLVNLNLASPALMERVFSGIGLAPAEATRLAQDVVDFRSPGDESVSGGSKSARYFSAGLRHGPKTAPFATVAELDQVIGMSPDLLERLRPLVTVHSRFGAVSPSAMSRALAIALGADPAAGIGAAALPVLPAEFTYVPRTRSTGLLTSNTYAVRVAVRAGGRRFTRSLVAELRPTVAIGMAVLDWGELDPDRHGVDPPATDDTPACIGGLLQMDPS